MADKLASQTFLWLTPADGPTAVLEITGKFEEVEPLGGERGDWAALVDRDSIAANSLAISFRDEDKVWVPPSSPSRQAAVQHFDQYENIRARVVVDRAYGAAFGATATSLDGRDHRVISGYALVAAFLTGSPERRQRRGLVVIRGALMNGAVGTAVTVGVPVSESGQFGRAHVFRGAALEDVIARLATERVGEREVGSELIGVLDAVEAATLATEVQAYPAEADFLGRTLSAWGRLVTASCAALAFGFAAVSGFVLIKSWRDQQAAATQQAEADQTNRQARQLVDGATWALSQRSSVDVAVLFAAAERAWRPLTRVSVVADTSKSVVTVFARRRLDVPGESIENPLVGDSAQLQTMISPPTIPGLTLSRSQITPDLNEVSYEYSMATARRIDRIVDR